MNDNYRHKGDGWIKTVTGRKVNVFEPRIDDIDIEDIAHGLSMIARFNGHLKHFYSVAEHSVLVAREAPEAIKLKALLHDASEAYLSDIARPIKMFLPEIQELEYKLQTCIFHRFGVGEGIPETLHKIDRRYAVTEAQASGMDTSDWNEQYEPYDIKSINFYRPQMAKRLFMHRFNTLYDGGWKRDLKRLSEESDADSGIQEQGISVLPTS